LKGRFTLLILLIDPDGSVDQRIESMFMRSLPYSEHPYPHRWVDIQRDRHRVFSKWLDDCQSSNRDAIRQYTFELNYKDENEGMDLQHYFRGSSQLGPIMSWNITIEYEKDGHEFYHDSSEIEVKLNGEPGG